MPHHATFCADEKYDISCMRRINYLEIVVENLKGRIVFVTKIENCVCAVVFLLKSSITRVHVRAFWQKLFKNYNFIQNFKFTFSKCLRRSTRARFLQIETYRQNDVKMQTFHNLINVIINLHNYSCVCHSLTDHFQPHLFLPINYIH